MEKILTRHGSRINDRRRRFLRCRRTGTQKVGHIFNRKTFINTIGRRIGRRRGRGGRGGGGGRCFTRDGGIGTRRH